MLEVAHTRQSLSMRPIDFAHFAAVSTILCPKTELSYDIQHRPLDVFLVAVRCMRNMRLNDKIIVLVSGVLNFLLNLAACFGRNVNMHLGFALNANGLNYIFTERLK